MSITFLCPTYAAPRFFGASRFFADAKFREFTQQKIICNEIISFDCCLFEMYEIASLDSPLHPDTQQIIAVIFRPEVEPAEYLERHGFTFCGYDLVDISTSISAVTDCGADFAVVPYDKLNEYGLISTYRDAVLTQLALVEEYPDEHHACCAVCEIWRRLV